MSNKQEINNLKKEVNKLVKSIQTLKNKLVRSQITIEEFNERKSTIEKVLSETLKKIAQYKETNPAKPIKKKRPLVGDAVKLKEKTQIEVTSKDERLTLEEIEKKLEDHSRNIKKKKKLVSLLMTKMVFIPSTLLKYLP